MMLKDVECLDVVIPEKMELRSVQHTLQYIYLSMCKLGIQIYVCMFTCLIETKRSMALRAL